MSRLPTVLACLVAPVLAVLLFAALTYPGRPRPVGGVLEEHAEFVNIIKREKAVRAAKGEGR